jgi:hypothetical protein
MTDWPADPTDELNRWITICDTDYYLLDPDQSEDEIEKAIIAGNPITIHVGYLRPGMDPKLFYMDGRLRVDPNHPCGRLTTQAHIKAGRLPWPG